MDSVEEIFLAKILLFSSDEEEELELSHSKKKRRYWVNPYYEKRATTGAYNNVVENIKHLKDDNKYHNYHRMSCSQFEQLLLQVSPEICKLTCIREPISPEIRLSITLRFLGTGESQVSLSLAYKCSPASVNNIIHETTKAITRVLKDKVFPKICEEYFRENANEFHRRSNFPHCIGAIDGKHVTIQAPFNSGSQFYNYKKNNSVVLLAICDAKYEFIMCDIGGAGRQSDGGIFRNSVFGNKFYSDALPIPQPDDVDEHFKNVPYVFVADDAFTLHKNMLKPYSKTRLSYKESIFNYRLSRARRMIENCFGILSSKWRIFRSNINANVSTVEDIILSCVCLHNWLRQINEDNYVIDVLNVEEQHNFLPLSSIPSNPSTEAKNIRNKFAEYFVTNGAVDWQNNFI